MFSFSAMESEYGLSSETGLMRASAAHVVPFANSRRTDAPELWPDPLSLHTIPFGQHNCLIDISASYLFTLFRFLHEKRSVLYGYSKLNCSKIVLMRSRCRFILSPRICKVETTFIILCYVSYVGYLRYVCCNKIMLPSI